MSWDHETPEVLGKIVLIGVSNCDAAGAVVSRDQWWGRIVAFNKKDGLKVRLSDADEIHAFPPFRDSLRSATPGVYELESTGEQVVDPDYLYTLKRHAPPDDH